MKKLYKVLILLLPVVLCFSYFPVISLGKSETMNFELSLPLVWLVVFDVVALVEVIRNKKIGLIFRNWWWLSFPAFATMAILWSDNMIRGVLTCGIMWLIYFAIFAFVALKENVWDERFRKYFWRVFFAAALMACVWCVVQCILDVVGVPRENSLMCEGCVSEMFGFPHPNGFAIEPQFMGNLLLAPAIVAGWFLISGTSLRSGSRPSGPSPRADGVPSRAAALRNPLAEADVPPAKKRQSFSWRRRQTWCGLFFFVIASTLFLTFSRGAIYAFIVAMIFMTALMMVRMKSARSLILWPVIILSFVVTLNLQGLLAEVGPTNDTYVDGVSKVINHLSLGIIDLRGGDVSEGDEIDDGSAVRENEQDVQNTQDTQDAVFDGYVEESTNIRMRLTEAAMTVWASDFRTAMVGVGIGGAGQAMFDAGETDSPKEIVQNEYASLLVEVGVVGMALVIFTAVMVVRWVIKNGGESSPLLLTVMLAYAVTLMFFSGFANALQVYLLPAVLAVVCGRGK